MHNHFILLIIISILIISTLEQVFFSRTQSLSLRLRPNQDIISSLTKSLAPYQLTALSVISAVGSVKYCWIRTANQPFLTLFEGPMQITSLSGTLDLRLQPHIHIQLADKEGNSIGGHLPSLQQRGIPQVILKDCPIYTTLQLVLLSHQDLIYERKVDPQTTYHELTIRTKSQDIL